MTTCPWCGTDSHEDVCPWCHRSKTRALDHDDTVVADRHLREIMGAIMIFALLTAIGVVAWVGFQLPVGR